ncbi:MAG TPA: DUF992 domain-containing protein [Pseudolabrys sp.]|nr:DUF992 domain-containing protein [Pseudolabrys sp.]
MIAFRRGCLAAMLALAATLSLSAQAQAPDGRWVQAGLLSCKVNPSVGYVIVGHQSLECLYTPSPDMAATTPVQNYDGALNTYGLNVGISGGRALGWVVFAPTTGVPAGALAGEYVGVSGDLGIGLAAGANVMVGGSNRSFALQPLSLQGSIAVNVVLGVSELKLRWH